MIPTRYGGVKRDKIRDKNGSSHGKSRNHNTALVSGFLGPLVPLGIYMIYKDRSRYVAYQFLQALIFQLVWWVDGGILAGVAWAISGILSAVLIGLLCMPIACLLSAIPLAALGYGIYGGIQTSQGQDFKYWLVGDWMRSTLTG